MFKTKLKKWLENTHTMWLFSVPIMAGGIIMILRDIFTSSRMEANFMLWNGIALGISGFGFLALIIRKEFYQMNILFKVARIEGTIVAIIGWIGLLICWLASIGIFIRIFLAY